MSEETTPDNSNSNDNWSNKWLIGGALLGALLGLTTAYLMVRNARATHGGPPEIGVGEGVGASIAILGVVRSLASLGD